MKLTAHGTVNGITATLTVEIDTETSSVKTGLPTSLDDSAIGRIQTVMRREAQRFAEIAAVNVADQAAERTERIRIANLPKNRPSIIVGAGTKSPDAVFVERGSFKVGTKTVKAAGER
jgi:hypothetical protein